MDTSNGPRTLAPLDEPVQRAERVYNALLEIIIRGELSLGEKVNADGIAQQLRVSTTPVRDALSRLEKDGLVTKLPYQGWFVRKFLPQEIRDIYEVRAGLECISVRFACERITSEEVDWLRERQTAGEEALARDDMEAYRLYNQELHAAILRAAKNSELALVASQLSRKTQMLSAKTVRMLGRPSRAVLEHSQLIDLIAARESAAAQQLMESHILGALTDILEQGLA